jgi:hypothetical protein
MRSFTIKDQKGFTSQLFTGTLFDSFLLCEADFKTSYTVHIDGRVCREYFDDAADIPSDPCNPWRAFRPTAFQIIKGKRLPIYFKLILALSSENLSKTLEASGLSLRPEDVEGMYLNVHYKDGILFCTSGISLRIFSMDRALPDYWDQLVARFFTQNGIDYE